MTKYNKTKLDEKNDGEEPKIEDFAVEPSKRDSKKKAYEVVLVTKNDVIYKAAVGNSFTPNIWGDKLKPGDTIYLEE
jgi:hypothetical protein